MGSGWRHRLLGLTGVVVFTGTAVFLVDNALVQSFATSLPILSRLSAESTESAEFLLEISTTVAVFVAAFFPLYRPRPRRVIDIASLAGRRVILGVLVLATIGYFDYTYRLPRLSLILLTPFLMSVLPAWFVWIRNRPSDEVGRTLIVGDDPGEVEKIVQAVDITIVGYLCPTRTFRATPDGRHPVVADGGTVTDHDRLGGLSRIEDVVVEYDIDTVVLAFSEADRAEFFGILDACYEHGVDVKAHPQHADSVLTNGSTGPLVDVEIEPWDVEDYVIKRAFDVVFAAAGLLALSPVMLAIAVAIKLGDGGPVFYSQERTAVLGETFDVYKFRTMVPEGESVTPVDDDENDRITDVGRLLRRTHLDEIPQLWSILIGKMSVVGPRAVWTDEEHLLEEESDMWRKRWFVKPGLTGLAQINDASSTNPEKKLQYDLKYVREQSFWFDTKIVARQIWKVLEDIFGSDH